MVRQDNERARRYIERQLDIVVAEPFIGLLIERNGEQVGAIVLNDYHPQRNIEVTAAADGPWNLADIRGILRYCFARAERITARTRTTNFQAIKRLKTLGFKHEGIMRNYFGEHDAAIFGLLKSEQRIFRDV